MDNLPSELVFYQILKNKPFDSNYWSFGKDWKRHYYINPNTHKSSWPYYYHHSDIQQMINENKDGLNTLSALINSKDPECLLLAKELLGKTKWTKNIEDVRYIGMIIMQII